MTARLFPSGWTGSIGWGSAVIPGTAGASALVTDTFTRGDATGIGDAETGQTWGGNAASWRIVSNECRQEASPPAGYSIATIDPAVADVDLRVKIVPSALSGNDTGPVARFTDTSNHILFDVVKDAGGWGCRAFEKLLGSYGGVTAFDYPIAELNNTFDPFMARIVVNGTAGEVFVTDQSDFETWYSKGTWTIDASLTATVCGLAANGSASAGFDDLSITAA